jgi:hypothetical protein
MDMGYASGGENSNISTMSMPPAGGAVPTLGSNTFSFGATTNAFGGAKPSSAQPFSFAGSTGANTSSTVALGATTGAPGNIGGIAFSFGAKTNSTSLSSTPLAQPSSSFMFKAPTSGSSNAGGSSSPFGSSSGTFMFGNSGSNVPTNTPMFSMNSGSTAVFGQMVGSGVGSGIGVAGVSNSFSLGSDKNSSTGNRRKVKVRR